MSRLRDLVSRVKEKFFTRRKKELSENSVPLFHFDRMTVDNEIRSNKELSRLVEQGEQDYPGFLSLVQDYFGALYKENPVLLPEESIAEEYRANRKHVQDLMDSDDYQQLRKNTKLNQSLAMAAARDLAQQVLEDATDESERRQEVREHQQELRELLEEAEQAELQGADEGTLEDLADEIEQAESRLESALASAKSQANLAGRQTRTVEQATARLAEQINDLMEMLRNFGYSKEQLERISTDTMLEMLREVMHHHNLKRMAELIGRFRQIARRLLAKSKQRDHFTISGVTLGDNLADMLPREAISALHPGLRPDFLRRWLEGNLEVWEREEEIEAGKGPLVVCVDVSGSMDGGKDAYAKSILMAYLEIAKKEHRDLWIIFYDHFLQKEYFLPRGRVSPKELIEILTFFTGGTTDFMAPLDRARVIITKNMKKADLLFVTDGQAQVDNDFITKFNQERKRLGFKVISAFVEDKERANRQAAIELLSSFSDAVFDVHDLTDENAERIIGEVIVE